jgi:hypothetical protein
MRRLAESFLMLSGSQLVQRARDGDDADGELFIARVRRTGLTAPPDDETRPAVPLCRECANAVRSELGPEKPRLTVLRGVWQLATSTIER